MPASSIASPIFDAPLPIKPPTAPTTSLFAKVSASFNASPSFSTPDFPGTLLTSLSITVAKESPVYNGPLPDDLIILALVFIPCSDILCGGL